MPSNVWWLQRAREPENMCVHSVVSITITVNPSERQPPACYICGAHVVLPLKVALWWSLVVSYTWCWKIGECFFFSALLISPPIKLWSMVEQSNHDDSQACKIYAQFWAFGRNVYDSQPNANKYFTRNIMIKSTPVSGIRQSVAASRDLFN